MKKRKDKSTRKTFAGIMRYLKPYSFFIVFTTFTALVQVASTLAIPYLAGVAINYMVYMDGVFAWEEIYKIFYGIAICIGAAALSHCLSCACRFEKGRLFQNRTVALEVY